MQTIDLLLLIMRVMAMCFFIIEALQIMIYSGTSRIYRSFGDIQLLMGGGFLLTIISEYFSITPLIYVGHLNLLWNLPVPAIVVLLYELIKGKRMRKRYIFANFLFFIMFFLVYSVNNNQDFLIVTKYLTLAYATIATLTLQWMMVKKLKHHEAVSEKHAYIWFAVVMWVMYVALLGRFVVSFVDYQLARLIIIPILIAVYAVVSFLLRHGLLDFHLLQREEVVDDFWGDVIPTTIPADKRPTDEAETLEDADNSLTEQNEYVQEQLLFFSNLARQLNELMESKQLYLNPDLTVAALSTELGTNRTYVSNLINQFLRTTFSAYVNAYRVKHAKNLLLETDDTVEEIFQASGFQSRTTFWRAFAQEVGCTPKEFRRRAMMEEMEE